MTDRVRKTDAEWRAQLSPEQYQVTRCKGTERPFTGHWLDNKADALRIQLAILLSRCGSAWCYHDYTRYPLLSGVVKPGRLFRCWLRKLLVELSCPSNESRALN